MKITAMQPVESVTDVLALLEMVRAGLDDAVAAASSSVSWPTLNWSSCYSPPISTTIGNSCRPDRKRSGYPKRAK